MTSKYPALGRQVDGLKKNIGPGGREPANPLFLQGNQEDAEFINGGEAPGMVQGKRSVNQPEI